MVRGLRVGSSSPEEHAVQFSLFDVGGVLACGVGDAVDVEPATVHLEEGADFPHGAGPVALLPGGRESDHSFVVPGLARPAVFDGQAGPTELGFEVDHVGAGVGMPGFQEVVPEPQHVGAVAGPHESDRGGCGSTAVVEGAATRLVGATGVAGADDEGITHEPSMSREVQ